MTEERDPLAALREELEVTVSPDFSDKVRARVACDLVAIETELADLEVSPGFAVGVRERIAQPQVSWTRWLRWQIVGPSLAAALLASLAVQGFRGGRETGFEVPEVQVVRGSEVPAGTGSGVSQPRAAAEPRTPQPHVAEPRTQSPLNPATPEPDVSGVSLEVITNQPAILAEIWAAASAAKTRVVAADVSSGEIQDIEVGTIEVRPVVVKWLIEPPVTGLPLPFIVRIAAEAARRPE